MTMMLASEVFPLGSTVSADTDVANERFHESAFPLLRFDPASVSALTEINRVDRQPLSTHYLCLSHQCIL